MRTALAAFVIAFSLITPARAQAQLPMPPAIKVQETVWVTNVDGFEIQGEVIATSADAIELATKSGIRRVAMRDVQIIEQKDSNKNGFWIGCAIGTLPALIESGGEVLSSGFGSALLAFNGLISGGIGWLVDNAIEGRDELYRKDADRIAVNIAPIVGLGESKHVGVGGSITWR